MLGGLLRLRRQPMSMRRPSRVVQAALGASAVLALMALVWIAPRVVSSIPDTGALLRDTTSVADVPAWVGAVSRLVNLVWAVTATLLLVASRFAAAHRRTALLGLAILTGALTLDDTLLIHDDLLPQQGVPEGIVLAGYAAFGLVLGVRWWPDRRTAVGAAFYSGSTLLAASVLVDALSDDLYLLEDAAKLLGVIAYALSGAWALSDSLHSGSGLPATEPDRR